MENSPKKSFQEGLTNAKVSQSRKDFAVKLRQKRRQQKFEKFRNENLTPLTGRLFRLEPNLDSIIQEDLVTFFNLTKTWIQQNLVSIEELQDLIGIIEILIQGKQNALDVCYNVGAFSEIVHQFQNYDENATVIFAQAVSWFALANNDFHSQKLLDEGVLQTWIDYMSDDKLIPFSLQILANIAMTRGRMRSQVVNTGILQLLFDIYTESPNRLPAASTCRFLAEALHFYRDIDYNQMNLENIFELMNSFTDDQDSQKYICLAISRILLVSENTQKFLNSPIINWFQSLELTNVNFGALHYLLSAYTNLTATYDIQVTIQVCSWPIIDSIPVLLDYQEEKIVKRTLQFVKNLLEEPTYLQFVQTPYFCKILTMMSDHRAQVRKEAIDLVYGLVQIMNESSWDLVNIGLVPALQEGFAKTNDVQMVSNLLDITKYVLNTAEEKLLEEQTDMRWVYAEFEESGWIEQIEAVMFANQPFNSETAKFILEELFEPNLLT